MALDCRNFHYYATQGEKWHYIYCHFIGKCAFDYIQLLNADNAEPLYLGRKIPFPNYFEKMKSLIQHTDTQKELELSFILHKLLTELIHLKKTEDFSLKSINYQQQLESSIAYIQQHFEENISIDQLAKFCNLNKHYFIKVFKAYTSQTPYEYLLNYRLQQAQRMLIETTKSVNEISHLAGFTESKGFIACFKNKTGITPLQFRKQNYIT